MGNLLKQVTKIYLAVGKSDHQTSDLSVLKGSRFDKLLKLGLISVASLKIILKKKLDLNTEELKSPFSPGILKRKKNHTFFFFLWFLKFDRPGPPVKSPRTFLSKQT